MVLPDHAAKVPVVEILLHPINSLAVMLFARQRPTVHREAFTGYSKTNSHLGQIIG